MLGDMSFEDLMEVDPALVRQVQDKLGKFYHCGFDYMDPVDYDSYEDEEDASVEGDDPNESVENEKDVWWEDDADNEYVEAGGQEVIGYFYC